MTKKPVQYKGISPEFKELTATWDEEHAADVDYLYIEEQMGADEFRYYVQSTLEADYFSVN